MKRICIDKRTNTVYPDFQNNPSPGTLIGNAMRQYTRLGQAVTELDFEEKEVSDDEYNLERETWKAQFIPVLEAKKLKKATDIESAKQKLKLTDDEFYILFPHLK